MTELYPILCVLLMTGLIFLSVLHLRRERAWLTVTESVLCAVGILLHPLLLIGLHRRLYSGSFEPAFADWAWDAVTIYVQYALPALGIFFLITTFSALSARWEKKYRTKLWRKLRSVCSLAASVVLLALAAFFAAMAYTQEIGLHSVICWLGVAGVLVLRGMYTAERFWMRTAEKEGNTVL